MFTPQMNSTHIIMAMVKQALVFMIPLSSNFAESVGLYIASSVFIPEGRVGWIKIRQHSTATAQTGTLKNESEN